MIINPLHRFLRFLPLLAMIATTGCAGRYQIVRGEFVNYNLSVDGKPYTRTDYQPILLDTWTGHTWTSGSSINIAHWQRNPRD